MPLLSDAAVSSLRGVFFILGASGSGKGTLATQLLQTKRIGAHVSMGDILRSRQNNPDLELDLFGEIPSGFSSKTLFLQHAVRTGLLIPDAWTQRIVEQELKQIPPNLLWAFDGYPRSPTAAQHVLMALEQNAILCLGVLHLRLEFPEMQRRLLARGRADDTPLGIANRYRFYLDSVLPSLEELRKRVAVLDLDANLEPSILANTVWDWLNRHARPGERLSNG
jgi:adenylate kinase